MKSPKKYTLKLTVEDIAILKVALLNSECIETEKGNTKNVKSFSRVNDIINNQLPEHY